nr:uncharacterized protein LOC122272584 [Parasteatoda tepidariorum]
MENLPEGQREAISACLRAAKSPSTGMRYTSQWIYECLLLKIKSTKAYNHLRSHQLLKLPSPATLYRYLKNVKGCYGFQSSIFKCLEGKSKVMTMANKRGCLLIDEMKVSPTLVFDKKSLEIPGFTDLGDYTPSSLTSQKGDHALALMFQPFREKWVQTIACFLSKNAASGTVTLMERNGFFVDAVVCEYATWNRSIFKKFGISLDSVSCEYITDPTRRSWFISDCPHLIKKNLKNDT